MRPVNRVTPTMPAAAYKTYRIWRPDEPGYMRPATCAQVECAPHVHGWTTTVDESSELGQRQAHYIRAVSGRHFTEERDPVGLTVFTFPPGERCFDEAAHRRPVEREPLYLVQGGDWRGNPRQTRARVHPKAQDWVDDFGEHQETLADRLAQG